MNTIKVTCIFFVLLFCTNKVKAQTTINYLIIDTTGFNSIHFINEKGDTLFTSTKHKDSFSLNIPNNEPQYVLLNINDECKKHFYFFVDTQNVEIIIADNTAKQIIINTKINELLQITRALNQYLSQVRTKIVAKAMKENDSTYYYHKLTETSLTKIIDMQYELYFNYTNSYPLLYLLDQYLLINSVSNDSTLALFQKVDTSLFKFTRYENLKKDMILYKKYNKHYTENENVYNENGEIVKLKEIIEKGYIFNYNPKKIKQNEAKTAYLFNSKQQLLQQVSCTQCYYLFQSEQYNNIDFCETSFVKELRKK